MLDDSEPIDPRVDIVFKRIFGTEGHTGVPKSFLNAIFKVAGLPAVRELTIKNPFRYAEFRGEKDIELDMLYIDEASREVQLEMQIAYHAGLEQRMLHNWAQLYLRQVDKGRSYRDHKPVVCLWVLERPLWDDGEWLHVMRMRCERTDTLFHGDLCIIAIELEAWRRLILERSGDTIIHEGEEQAWLYFLAKGYTLSPGELRVVLPNPIFTEALELMAGFNVLKKWRHYYDMRRNYTHLIASYKETGYDEGRQEGLEEGRKQGLEQGLEQGRTQGLEQGRAQGFDEGKDEARRAAAMKMAEQGLQPAFIARVLDLKPEEAEAIVRNSRP